MKYFINIFKKIGQIGQIAYMEIFATRLRFYHRIPVCYKTALFL
jgi:hypothetical protein